MENTNALDINKEYKKLRNKKKSQSNNGKHINKKLLPRQKIIKKLDTITSRIVRIKYADDKGYITCISCGKRLYWKDSHCCHFIDRGILRYRFDYDNLRPGCAGCNTFRQQFHMREYFIKLVDQFGFNKIKEMQNLSKQSYKISTPDLRQMLEDRKQELKVLENKLNINE